MTLCYPPPVGNLTRRRVIAIWTSSNPANWAAEGYRRIYEREILARLPDVHIRFIGDLADDAAMASERGDVMTSLANALDERGVLPGGLVAAALSLRDLEFLAGDLARHALRHGTPLILSALSSVDDPARASDALVQMIAATADVTARDTRSLEWVRSLRGAPCGLLPDPLVLLPRLTTSAAISSRINYLRTVDGYPLLHSVVVEVRAAHAEHLLALDQHVARARARGYRIAVVVVPVAGESMTAELRHCTERMSEPVFCVDRLSFEDRIAMVATAAAVVPLSPALLAAACAYGRPSFRCTDAAWSRNAALQTFPGAEQLLHENFDAMMQTQPAPSVAEPWRVAMDAHLDRAITAFSATPLERPSARTPADDLVAAFEATRRAARPHVADERLRLARRTEGWLSEIAELRRDRARQQAREAAVREEAAAAVARARSESAQAADALRTTLEEDTRRMAAAIERLSTERDELQAAVDRFARSRSWRYLAPARAIGQALRRLLDVRA